MGGVLAFLLKHGVDFSSAVTMLQKCRQGGIKKGGKDWIYILRTPGGQSFASQVKLAYKQLADYGVETLRTEIFSGYIIDPRWTV
jgi:hypothetical protein